MLSGSPLAQADTLKKSDAPEPKQEQAQTFSIWNPFTWFRKPHLPLQDLPVELLLEVIEFLTPQEIYRLSMANKHFNALLTHHAVSHQLYKKYFRQDAAQKELVFGRHANSWETLSSRLKNLEQDVSEEAQFRKEKLKGKLAEKEAIVGRFWRGHFAAKFAMATKLSPSLTELFNQIVMDDLEAIKRNLDKQKIWKELLSINETLGIPNLFYLLTVARRHKKRTILDYFYQCSNQAKEVFPDWVWGIICAQPINTILDAMVFVNHGRLDIVDPANGLSAIYYAVLMQDNNLLNELIERHVPVMGAMNVKKINMSGGWFGPLHAAVDRDNYEAVTILVTRAIDYQAFRLAVESNRVEMVKLFLSNFNPFVVAKHINTPDSENRSLFRDVCKQGNVAMARLLLEHGAEPHYKNINMLYEALTNNTDTKLVDLLLEYGANPSSGYPSALDRAIRRNDTELAQRLVDAKGFCHPVRFNRNSPENAAWTIIANARLKLFNEYLQSGSNQSRSGIILRALEWYKNSLPTHADAERKRIKNFIRVVSCFPEQDLSKEEFDKLLTSAFPLGSNNVAPDFRLALDKIYSVLAIPEHEVINTSKGRLG